MGTKIIRGLAVLMFMAIGVFAPSSSVHAEGEPALVSFGEGCAVGSLVFAYPGVLDIPTIAQIRTDVGQGVVIRDENGKLTCRGQLDLGSVTEGTAFLPGPVPHVPVRIMTWEEACHYGPLLGVSECRGGNGASIVDGAELGILCNDGYIDANGEFTRRTTMDWRQVLSPGGSFTTTCKFR